MVLVWGYNRLMSLFFLLPSGRRPYTVTLSGATVSNVGAGGTKTSGIRIASDGTVQANNDGLFTQLSLTTDWIIPNAYASTDFDVRITNVVWTSGAAFDTEAAAEDTWIDLGSNRDWNIVDSNSGAAGVKDVTFDVEIRDPYGVTAASASYTLYCDYEV